MYHDTDTDTFSQKYPDTDTTSKYHDTLDTF